LHTSRGLEHRSAGISKTIHKGLSIAPGSILSAIHIITKEGLTPDIYIFETSIGGTGCADIGVITSFFEDYSIAAGTSLASDAKLQMVTNARKGSKQIINLSCEKAISCALQQHLPYITFSDEDNKADVRFISSSDEKHISFSLITKDRVVKGVTGNGYDRSSYSMAMAAACAVALSLDVSIDTIIRALSDFTGLSGRMKVSKADGRVIIDNSNSGLNIGLVEDCLDYSLSIKGDNNIFMILGEQARQVCEGLGPDKVKQLLIHRHMDISGLCLIGERMHDTGIERIFNGPIYFEDDMERAMASAFKNTGAGDLIISCVKSFR
jgi:UDP-N-acetylmuramyl pentapeptide synthase